MRLQFLIFITVAALIVFAAHLGFYLSCVELFQISDEYLLKLFRIVTLLLSLSFLASSFLVHWRENFATRMVYLASSVWLGSFLYLLIATVVAWVIFALLKFTDQMQFARVLISIPYALALVYAGYGLISAQNPRIRQIEVPIRNLPESWRERTLVQLSDIHLGAINRKRFMSRVVSKVKGIRPDVVLITGDLFDGVGRDLNSLAAPLGELRPPLGAFFITGNHEVYAGLERSLAALKGLHLKILQNEIVRIDGVQLVGINYPTSLQPIDLEGILGKLDSHTPSIALFHVPTRVDQFKKHGINLMLSGHTHVGQMWPFNYITRRVYHGRDYGLHLDGDFGIYITSGVGTWGPPLRTGTRPEIVQIRLVPKQS